MARQGMSPGIRREGLMARNGVIAGNGQRSPAGAHDYACGGDLVQRVLGSLRVTQSHSGVYRLLLLHDPCSERPPRRERTYSVRQHGQQEQKAGTPQRNRVDSPL